eukprot:Amastigsp_a510486_28.p2 type:complete len:222 gc:universal Amastigsp_a510486_28:98-763(+)
MAKILHLKRRAPLAPGLARKQQRRVLGTTNRKTRWDDDLSDEQDRDERAERATAGLSLANAAPPAGLPSVRSAPSGSNALLAHVPLPKALDWASAEARQAWRKQFLRRSTHGRFGFEHAVRDSSHVLSAGPKTDFYASESERFLRDATAIVREDKDRRARVEAGRLARLQSNHASTSEHVHIAEDRAAARDMGRIRSIVAQRARYHAALSQDGLSTARSLG